MEILRSQGLIKKVVIARACHWGKISPKLPDLSWRELCSLNTTRRVSLGSIPEYAISQIADLTRTWHCLQDCGSWFALTTWYTFGFLSMLGKGAWAKSYKEASSSCLAKGIHSQLAWPAERQRPSLSCPCPASLIELFIQDINQVPSLWQSVSEYGPISAFSLCMPGLLLTSGWDTSCSFYLGWPWCLI